MPKKYRKKPVVVEALQVVYGKTEVSEVEEFLGNSDIRYLDQKTGKEYIRTLEGDMLISDGDYIIKGIQGEFYPCKPDIFEASYEEYKGVSTKVSIVDTDVFKNILDKASDLIAQIEKSNFTDEKGHELTMNQAYQCFLGSFGLNVKTL